MRYREVTYRRGVARWCGSYTVTDFSNGASRAMRYRYSRLDGWIMECITGRRKSVKRRMRQSIRDLQNK